MSAENECSFRPKPAPPNPDKLRDALEQRAAEWRATLREEPTVARRRRRLVGPLTLWDAFAKTLVNTARLGITDPSSISAADLIDPDASNRLSLLPEGQEQRSDSHCQRSCDGDCPHPVEHHPAAYFCR
jgi:hypothetical protein